MAEIVANRPRGKKARASKRVSRLSLCCQVDDRLAGDDRQDRATRPRKAPWHFTTSMTSLPRDDRNHGRYDRGKHRGTAAGSMTSLPRDDRRRRATLPRLSSNNFPDLIMRFKVFLRSLREASMKTTRTDVVAFALLLSLISLGCSKPSDPSNPDDPSKAKDPVAQLRAVLARIEKNGTQERIVNGGTWNVDPSGGKGWVKRKYTASDLKFDVRKTDSLVSPLTAVVTFDPVQYSGPLCQTQQDAERTTLGANPSHKWGERLYGQRSGPFTAALAWQEGKWVLNELEWDCPAMGDFIPANHRKYSDLSPDSFDPLTDWWRAFSADLP